MADISDNVRKAEQEQLEKAQAGQLEQKLDLTLLERPLFWSMDKAKKAATAVLFFGGLYTAIGMNPLITSAGFMLGETIVKTKTGEGVKLKNLKNEAYSGAAMGTFLHYFFTGVPYVPGLIGKGLYGLAAIPVFNFLHFGVDHNVKKYKPTTLYQKTLDEGLGSVLSETYRESIKPKWAKSIKSVSTKPAPGLFPLGVAANTAASYSVTAKMFGALLLSTIYRSVTIEKPEKKEEQPHTVANLPGGNYYTGGQPARA